MLMKQIKLKCLRVLIEITDVHKFLQPYEHTATYCIFRLLPCVLPLRIQLLYNYILHDKSCTWMVKRIELSSEKAYLPGVGVTMISKAVPPG